MEIKENTVVTMEYTGKLKDGKVFDTSENREPLKFIFGSKTIIPGLEEGISGLKKGDKKKVEIPVDKAYGQYNEQAIQEIPKTEFPKDIELKVGLQLMAQTPYGPVPVMIKDLKEENIVVDFNHPLAGKELVFDVEIVDITEATEEDVKTLAPHTLPQEENPKNNQKPKDSEDCSDDDCSTCEGC